MDLLLDTHAFIWWTARDPRLADTLDISSRHADAAGSLPFHHADPFDRLLVAQARIEGLVLVSQDRQLLPYGVPILGMS